MPAALGFSDHSGWAVVAAIERDGTERFRLLFRRRIETCPPHLPRQAYHAVAEAGASRSVIAEVAITARDCCSAAIAAALSEFPAIGSAAVAMGRASIPLHLDRILASHTLLHAAEGELYRDALCEAAAVNGLSVVRFFNKEVRSEAANALSRPLAELDGILASIGQSAGKPWTKDEKDAAAAAIFALATLQ